MRAVFFDQQHCTPGPEAGAMTSDKRQSRRRFLLGSAALAPSVALSHAQAQETAKEQPREADLSRSAPAPATPAVSDYKPGYFTADEWRFVLAACDRLIPKDEIGPGAVELGVPQYIDRQLQTAYGHGGNWYMQGPFHQAAAEFGYQSKLTPKEQFRLGIRAIDAHCRQDFSKAFADLSAAQQDGVLKDVEGGKIKAEDVPLATFFASFLLKNTLEGYFGDPMYGGNKDMAAWKMIGFPGAHYDYKEWVARHGERVPFPTVGFKGRPGWTERKA
jgi:gluconate 2-dehydrogenase gamma chain